jgi:hypothetical protein
MIRVVIISGIAFTIGNIIWPLFNEPKIFYIPLAIFISSMLWEIKSKISNSKCLYVLTDYLLLLSLGNIVKQVFYSDNIAQINDYFWGGLVTVRLLFKLKKHLKWETRKTTLGGKK